MYLVGVADCRLSEELRHLNDASGGDLRKRRTVDSGYSSTADSSAQSVITQVSPNEVSGSVLFCTSATVY